MVFSAALVRLFSSVRAMKYWMLTAFILSYGFDAT